MKPLFDLSLVLSEKEGIGGILKAAISYDAHSSLIAFVAYMTYILGFEYYFFGRKKT
jgi:hypothetical protein